MKMKEICPMRDGNGFLVDDDDNEVTCDACKGEGWINTEDFA